MEELSHAVSGAFAAIGSTFFVHPLETFRTQMQGNNDQKTLMETIKEIFQKSGVAGMYAGLKSALVLQGFSYSVYFCIYRYVQKVILSRKPQLEILDHLIVSAISSVTITLLNNPIWVVNTRQMKGIDGGGLRNSFRGIVNDEGLSGLYKGILPSLILSINPIIQFVGYEILKQTFEGKYNSAFAFFLMGALSKLLATIITFPLITIKTKIQLQKDEVTTTQAIQQILETEGISGFYRGLSSKVIHSVLSAALIMSLHEKMSAFLVRILIPNRPEAEVGSVIEKNQQLISSYSVSKQT